MDLQKINNIHMDLLHAFIFSVWTRWMNARNYFLKRGFSGHGSWRVRSQHPDLQHVSCGIKDPCLNSWNAIDLTEYSHFILEPAIWTSLFVSGKKQINCFFEVLFLKPWCMAILRLFYDINQNGYSHCISWTSNQNDLARASGYRNNIEYYWVITKDMI